MDALMEMASFEVASGGQINFSSQAFLAEGNPFGDT
jgi:hypothetical protein